MNDSLHEALEQAIARHRHGSGLVLLFDYDGTLVDYSDHPAAATLTPETRQNLAALALLPGVTVGVISGRELEELKRMIGLAGLFYAGTDGLELEYQGEVVTHPLAWHCTDLVTRVSDALGPFVRAFPTASLECKKFGLTVHFRRLDPQLASLLQDGLEQHLAPWAERLHVVTGAKAVEITPNIGWTKGTAVEYLMEHLNAKECHVLYAGDEASDIEAIWTVGSKGGTAIGVGPGSPCVAQYKLPDASAVQHLLDDLCHRLGGVGCAISPGRAGHESPPHLTC